MSEPSAYNELVAGLSGALDALTRARRAVSSDGWMMPGDDLPARVIAEEQIDIATAKVARVLGQLAATLDALDTGDAK